MKELGAESAAIQLDAGAGSAQHVLLGRTQIALKPTAKGLGMPRIFVRAKRCKYLTADSALKRMQVHAWAFWLDADAIIEALHLGQAGRSNGAGGMADNRR